MKMYWNVNMLTPESPLLVNSSIRDKNVGRENIWNFLIESIALESTGLLHRDFITTLGWMESTLTFTRDKAWVVKSFLPLFL